MVDIRHSENRGLTRLGWLHSRHSFSFGEYYDPQHMGVSALRVINDDRVVPGAGFATHSHRDMEIISYVKRGRIEHKDSLGNVDTLSAGEFQLMTAGTGVTHSEYNPSRSEPLEFLQIWIHPDQTGLPPGYQQKRFQPASGLQLIASRDARDGSLQLHQDAALYRLQMRPDEDAELSTAPGRTVYVHVITGNLSLAGEILSAGDGATISAATHNTFAALKAPVEALVFDLPPATPAR